MSNIKIPDEEDGLEPNINVSFIVISAKKLFLWGNSSARSIVCRTWSQPFNQPIRVLRLLTPRNGMIGTFEYEQAPARG